MEEAASRQRDEGEALLHYYVAVDRQQFKLGTLFDLLEHLCKRVAVPLVICCSTRDSLDVVLAAAASRPHFSTKCLHSDLEEHERSTALEEFQLAVSEWRKASADGKYPERLSLLVVTDACLPSAAHGEHSLSATTMINYDLPVKKEAYVRRLSACLSLSGIVLNMVVGAEGTLLKAIEEGCGSIIREMPINITELLSN